MPVHKSGRNHGICEEDRGEENWNCNLCRAFERKSDIGFYFESARFWKLFGIACKAGAQKKTSVGIPDRCNMVGENMCNPILQAKMLNEAKTDLNVVVGLCVGHDSLFYKYSEALTTTAVTKDRVLGHNPAAALYTADSYYSRLKE